MSRVRAALRREDGHTLIELLVTMTLAVLVLGVVLLIGQLFTTHSGSVNKLTQVEDDSRSQMSRMVRLIRDAPQRATATNPIAIARTHDLIIAGTSSAGAPIWVRFCTSGASNQILRLGTMTRTTTSPTDPGAACPAGVSGGWTYGTLVSSGLLTPDSLFTYVCAGSGGCTTAKINQLTVRLERSTQSTRSVVLTSAVSPRNFP